MPQSKTEKAFKLKKHLLIFISSQEDNREFKLCLVPLKRLLGVKTDPFFHTFLNSNIHFREIKRTSSFFPSNFHHISK